MSERIPNGFVARMLAGHAGLGVALAALLYILSVTGTLVVFHPEWTRWEQPHVPEMAQAEPGTVERLADTAAEVIVTGQRLGAGVYMPGFIDQYRVGVRPTGIDPQRKAHLPPPAPKAGTLIERAASQKGFPAPGANRPGRPTQSDAGGCGSTPSGGKSIRTR